MRALGRGLAWLFVKLRLVIVLAWIAGTAWAVIALPAIHTSSSGTLADLLPANSPALRAERISAQRFAFPVISRTLIVVRNPQGLPARRQAQLLDLARKLSTHQLPGYGQIKAALPLLDRVGRAPFVSHPGTTLLLYLLFDPSASSGLRTTLAQRVVDRQIGHRPGEFAGVTGEAPARTMEEDLIQSYLPWVELATILLVTVAVGLHFRAVPAALLTLAAVVGAYLVAEHLVAELSRLAHVTIPSQAEPVLVVLVFGVATDYSVFFLSRFRGLLAAGVERRRAAQGVVREISPIVLTAGITVALGTATLLVAKLGFVRGFGPALAIAVLLAMLVAVTFVPALLAVGGRRVYWPAGIPPAAAEVSAATAQPGQGQPVTEPPRRGRLATARLASRHPVLAAVFALALIGAAASGLRLIAVANETVTALPSSSAPYRAYEVARQGFAPGVLAPVVVVVTGPRAGADSAALARVQRGLSRSAGVADVIGPATTPLPLSTGLGIWRTHGAARFALFLDRDPLSARSISDVRSLQGRLPALLRGAGLGHARALIAGDTALSSDIVAATRTDLARVTPTMLAVIFVVIALFLRAVIGPLYLVATSVMAAAAALGLTAYVMQGLVGYGQTTYYVIFTVVVLLISLGSDYNVFLVGRIWQEARRRPLREAVGSAGASAARPIATAAVVLALSFALLVIVPVRAFREIAFAMAAGLLVDAFIVRAILVPALLVLVGQRSAWPGRGLRGGRRSDAAPAAGLPQAPGA